MTQQLPKAQHRVGVLMLDTRFPRPVGDIGNPQTFANTGLAVTYRVLSGASPRRIVNANDPGLLNDFIEAAHELIDEGATLITTSCGFLARYQTAMNQALPVPVITSSLLLCTHLPHPVVLTIDAASLSTDLLQAAGVPAGTPIIGVPPDSHFRQQILGNQSTLDEQRACDELVSLVKDLRQNLPAAEHLVLECTNMPPYAAAISAASGLPVHHLMMAIADHAREHPV